MALVLDIKDLLSSGSRLRGEREEPVRVAVYVDAEAPEPVVEAVRAALRPQMSTARIHVEPVVPGDVLVVDAAADAVVTLAGPGSTLAPSLRRAREMFVPTAVLALYEERDDVARRLDHPLLDTLVAADADALMLALGHWLSDRVGSKRLALAANFPFVRKAVALEAVKATAFQNAVVGGVVIIPGADMPIMTANQAKMVLQIAAAYGEPLGAERIKELAAVVGGAFALRTVARQLAAFVPGAGWAFKAAIGYTGTLAMGHAAVDYFEHGGDIGGLGERLRETRDRAVRIAKARTGRALPAEPSVAPTSAPLPALTDGSEDAG